MKCSKCGNENVEGTRFCVNCGNSLESIKTEDTSKKETVKKTNPIKNIDFKTYFELLWKGILKPSDFLKNNLTKLENTKDCLFICGIIVVINTLLALLKTMFNAAYSLNIWTNERSFEFSNLGNVNYFKTIGMNLALSAALIALFASLYYVAGLIMKKEIKYIRLVSLSALATIPIFVCINLFSTILGLIHSSLSVSILIIGLVYTLLILCTGMDQELKLEGDEKLFTHLVCLSIAGIALYVVGVNMITSAATSVISSLI